MDNPPALQIKTPFSVRLGVLGAGTMGSGIALAALLAGMRVTLYDLAPQMLEKAKGYISSHLERKGRAESLPNLELANALDAIGGAGVVIEAAPEQLALKQELFVQVEARCSPPAILATNTSTLPVTAIAAALSHPERAAGMHFFNPAAVMPLVEVVRAGRTNPETIQALVDLATLLGKTPVVTRDTPGFIVNRIARPFYGEALRLVGEGAAEPEIVDRILRMGGGFRMGPFELMDLIGVDINYAATQSMYEQSLAEPRYKPHPLQAEKVRLNQLGRKTGSGFYDYATSEREPDPTPAIQNNQQGTLVFSPGSWAPGLVNACRQAGYAVQEPLSLEDAGSGTMVSSRVAPLVGFVQAGRGENLERILPAIDQLLPPEAPLLCQCVDVTVAELATWVQHPERLVGFDGLFFGNGTAVTLAPSPLLAPPVREATEQLFRSLGKLPIWVADSPALVLPRIVGMLANEAAFALSEGVADADTIDLAMRLGANYPLGPIAWMKRLGATRVEGLIDHLYNEYHEERYRLSPLVRRWSRLDRIQVD